MQKIYYLDNTGSGEKSGGSDKLVEYMEENKYSKALNTQDGVIKLPKCKAKSNTKKGVRLGVLDCWNNL